MRCDNFLSFIKKKKNLQVLKADIASVLVTKDIIIDIDAHFTCVYMDQTSTLIIRYHLSFQIFLLFL